MTHTDNPDTAPELPPTPEAAGEIRDKARNLHPIRLVPFVAVVVLINVVNLIWTLRIHSLLWRWTELNDWVVVTSWVANTVFALLLVFALYAVATRHRRAPQIALPMMLVYLSVATINVLINITILIIAPSFSRGQQLSLIIVLGLSFTAITLVYSLWYQIADTHLKGGALDFPPNANDPDGPPKWFDYLVVAFFTNSTFGPTLENVRTRPAKAIMMSQTALSVLVLVVLVARIVTSTR